MRPVTATIGRERRAAGRAARRAGPWTVGLVMAVIADVTVLASPGAATASPAPGSRTPPGTGPATAAPLDLAIVTTVGGLALVIGLLLVGRRQLARRRAIQRFRRQLEHPDVMSLVQPKGVGYPGGLGDTPRNPGQPARRPGPDGWPRREARRGSSG